MSTASHYTPFLLGFSAQNQTRGLSSLGNKGKRLPRHHFNLKWITVSHSKAPSWWTLALCPSGVPCGWSKLGIKCDKLNVSSRKTIKLVEYFPITAHTKLFYSSKPTPICQSWPFLIYYILLYKSSVLIIIMVPCSSPCELAVTEMTPHKNEGVCI